MWIWGGSVRVPLQSPQFDATLGLVSLGSAEMLVRVLGKDVLVLWRSLLLRRRIVLVADSVEEVARGVCGALALIASPCIDFAARDGQAPPIIDSVFPYIALGQTGALESAALPLAHWPSECAKAPEAASLGRVGGGASGACAAPNAAAALNALPFYLAGVVSSHGAPGGFAAEGGPGIEGSGKRWVRGLLGGLSTAQVLLLHACVNCYILSRQIGAQGACFWGTHLQLSSQRGRRSTASVLALAPLVQAPGALREVEGV